MSKKKEPTCQLDSGYVRIDFQHLWWHDIGNISACVCWGDANWKQTKKEDKDENEQNNAI